MKYFKLNFDEKLNIDNIVIALGNFDGFHLGHKKLIDELKKIKKAKSLSTAVLLFENHTKDFIQNKQSQRLMSNTDKINTLKDESIDFVISIDFDDDFKKLSAVEFLDFLTINLNVKHIVVGEDYRFSKNQQGNVETIEKYMYEKGLSCSILKKINYKDKKISSSDIIEYIKSGDLKLSNKLLGYFYSVNGIVESGYKRGRKLGFPTANLSLNFNYVIPKEGVYFTKTEINDNIYYSFTSIGNNPTFENRANTIETHIFNFSDDLYNRDMKIYFLEKIRDNIKFDKVDDLILQLSEDLKTCKKLITLYEN